MTDPAGSERARELLRLAKVVTWDFPSSLGRPAGAEPGDAVEQLLAAHEELPAAAEALLEDGYAETATDLAARTWRVWMLARDPSGGRAFLAPVLAAAAGPPATRALALYGDSVLAYWTGERDAAHRRAAEALSAAQEAGDPEALALAHLARSRAEFEDGDAQAAVDHAVAARRHAGSLAPAFGQAPLHMHAQSARLQGDLDGAAALFAESLALNRSIGDAGMVGVELHNLGQVELRRGNVDEAERLFAEAGAYAGDDPYDVGMATFVAAAVAHARGDDERAAGLLAEADEVFRRAGIEPAADDAAELEWLRAVLFRRP